MSNMYCQLYSEIDLVILFYFCKVPAIVLSIQCLTNYFFRTRTRRRRRVIDDRVGL
jgi:hypothetical protein